MNIGIIFFAAAIIGLVAVAFLWHFMKPSDRAKELFYCASYGKPEDHDPKYQKVSFLGQIFVVIFFLGIFTLALYAFGVDVQAYIKIITK